MTPFETEAVRTALRHMFRAEGYFSICTLKECLEVARVTPPSREMAALQVLHCVHWGAMTPALRQEVANRVLALFDEPTLDVAWLYETPEKQKAVIETTQRPTQERWFARLLKVGSA